MLTVRFPGERNMRGGRHGFPPRGDSRKPKEFPLFPKWLLQDPDEFKESIHGPGTAAMFGMYGFAKENEGLHLTVRFHFYFGRPICQEMHEFPLVLRKLGNHFFGRIFPGSSGNASPRHVIWAADSRLSKCWIPQRISEHEGMYP